MGEKQWKGTARRQLAAWPGQSGRGYFNLTRPGDIEDPYPALAALRRQEPVHRSPDLGAWVVTSYEHCERLVRDDETFSSDPAHATGGLGESVRAVRDQVPLGTAPILGNTTRRTTRVSAPS